MIDNVIERLAQVTELETALDLEVAAGLGVPGDIEELVAGDNVTWAT